MNLVKYPTSSTVRLQESYKIPFSKHEVQFLNWLYPEVMACAKHRAFRLLEVSDFHDMCQRLSSKLYAGEKAKMKLRLAEVLATKRLLLKTPNVGAWKTESDSILFKLDQLTVGIQ